MGVYGALFWMSGVSGGRGGGLVGEALFWVGGCGCG